MMTPPVAIPRPALVQSLANSNAGNASGEPASSSSGEVAGLGIGRCLVLAGAFADPSEGAWPAKFARVVLDAGYSLEFLAWERDADSPKVTPFEREPGFRRHVLLRGGGRRTVARIGRYPLWMWKLFWRCLKANPRTIFVGISFDTALPMAVASLLGGTTYVFADLDNISLSYRWFWPFRVVLSQVEKFIAARCALHILPGHSRCATPGPRERFLRNSPASKIIAEAKQIACERGYQRGITLTVYVNGWLVETRGLQVILDAYKKCPSGVVELLVAGKDGCAALEELNSLPGVAWFGKLGAAESLALYYRSHLVFTYYDPTIEINRLAEPNKWEDCIATQTPFMVNSEVQTAQRFITAGACVHAPYHDADALAFQLRSLAAERDRWIRLCERLAAFQTPAWDVEMLRFLEELPWQGTFDEPSVIGSLRRHVREDGARPEPDPTAPVREDVPGER